jgi:hypothetical protein
MLKFVKKLLAVPVRVLARLLGIGNFFDTTALWSIVFKLTAGAEDGTSLLYTIYQKYGLDEARIAAQKIISASQSAKPIVIIASLEFREGNINETDRWVRLAAESNAKDADQLLVIKLYLSEFFSEYDKKSIIEEILSKNYLPMEVTRLALIEKSFLALEEKDWPLAGKIADRILSVEEHFAARIVKAAIAMVNKNITAAEQLLTKAQHKTQPAQFYPLASQALLCIGQSEMAMEYLCRAGRLDGRLIQSNTPLGKLARSQEFQDYCQRRQHK